MKNKELVKQLKKLPKNSEILINGKAATLTVCFSFDSDGNEYVKIYTQEREERNNEQKENDNGKGIGK